MRLLEWLRNSRTRPSHLIGHVADEPKVISEDGSSCMVFRITEAPHIEFRLRMSPMTPARKQGDRVELSFVSDNTGIATVDSLFALPDRTAARRKQQEYLERVRQQHSDR
jgi:hypothetical protein